MDIIGDRAETKHNGSYATFPFHAGYRAGVAVNLPGRTGIPYIVVWDEIGKGVTALKQYGKGWGGERDRADSVFEFMLTPSTHSIHTPHTHYCSICPVFALGTNINKIKHLVNIAHGVNKTKVVRQ